MISLVAASKVNRGHILLEVLIAVVVVSAISVAVVGAIAAARDASSEVSGRCERLRWETRVVSAVCAEPSGERSEPSIASAGVVGVRIAEDDSAVVHHLRLSQASLRTVRFQRGGVRWVICPEPGTQRWRP